MRVEQAVYGQVSERGHGLRDSSEKSRLAAEIYSRLDLPDGVPGGVQGWSPFVRGFPVGDHYVIAKTFLDSSASRGGMVLSHALIVSLDDVCGLGSLAPLFGLLATAVDQVPIWPTTLDLELAGSHEPYAPELVGAANALATQQQLPVVSAGVPGFEGLVDALWQNVSPEMRRAFAFRLSFGPTDLVEQPLPTIVCTPEQLRARWLKHAVVNPDDAVPASAVAAVLCGQRPLAPLVALAADLGVTLATVKDLSRIERIQTLVEGKGDFDDLLSAVRMVDGLSSDPKVGVATKSALLRRLVGLVPATSASQLLVLRNLLLAGFSQAEQFWSAVELAVAKLKFEPAQDAELGELAQAAGDEELAFGPWRAAATTGLLVASRKYGAPIYKAVWRWAESNSPAFSAVVDALPTERAFEQRLAAAVPKRLQVTKPEQLLAPVLKKRWLVAYGTVLAATLAPLDAARQQLKVDKAAGHSEGLKAALGHANAAQVLECAVREKDSRLVDMAADIAVSDPKVLSGIRGQDISAQQVWAAAIKKKSSLWNAPKKAADVRDTVLEQLVDGHAVEPSLLEALAQTPLADVCSFPRRAELWHRLPQRDAYLQATAAGWLEQAGTSGKATAPEDTLERAIIASPQLRALLGTPSVSVDASLSIVAALASFSESMFITWLETMLQGMSVLSTASSERLGTLIASQRWDRATNTLADFYSTRRRADLLPALRACSGLLGMFTRWRLGVFAPTVTEKWAALEDAACDLYPAGPDDEQLWSRAGGKKSDLPGGFQSGAARWHAALSSIRFGGRPKTRELLFHMLKDFPDNEQLRLYASDTDIVGYR